MIKNRLSTIMGYKRIKPHEIVTLTGISRKTLYNIYNDKTKGIEFETLNKLCLLWTALLTICSDMNLIN